jgi:hypothetical protein
LTVADVLLAMWKVLLLAVYIRPRVAMFWEAGKLRTLVPVLVCDPGQALRWPVSAGVTAVMLRTRVGFCATMARGAGTPCGVPLVGRGLLVRRVSRIRAALSGWQYWRDWRAGGPMRPSGTAGVVLTVGRLMWPSREGRGCP